MNTDKTTQAVLRYLLTDDADAFDHLIAICWRAKRRLFTPPESFVGDDPKAWATSLDRSRRYNPNTAHGATHLWIEDWLLAFLEPYRHVTANELQLLASSGEFRHLGNKCCLDMIDEIRRIYRRRSVEILSLDTPLAVDHSGHELTFKDLLPVDQILDIDALLQDDSLKTALGERVLGILKAVIDVASTNGRQSKGEVTRIIGEAAGVKEWQARALKQQLKAALVKYLQGRPPFLGVWTNKDERRKGIVLLLAEPPSAGLPFVYPLLPKESEAVQRSLKFNATSREEHLRRFLATVLDGKRGSKSLGEIVYVPSAGTFGVLLRRHRGSALAEIMLLPDRCIIQARPGVPWRTFMTKAKALAKGQPLGASVHRILGGARKKRRKRTRAVASTHL